MRAYGIPDDRIAVVPNWTHITPATASRDDARAALGWPPDRFIVAHTGNMGLKQDLGNVVEAARRLPGSAEVLLIGDGSQRHAIETQASGVRNVRFLDPLNDAEYPLALAAADLLLINERPSVGDMSLPSKLTSYLSAGRPVLAAVSEDGATAAELQRTSGAGAIVSPGNPGQLADAIIELRDDPAGRAEMGRVGWRYAHARFDRTSSLLRLEGMLRELLPAPSLVVNVPDPR